MSSECERWTWAMDVRNGRQGGSKWVHLGRLEAEDEADELEKHHRHKVAVHGRDGRRGQLLAEELAACRRPAAADGRVSEDADQDGAKRTAHAVHAPDVEGVVPLHAVLQLTAAVCEGPWGRRGRWDVRGNFRFLIGLQCNIREG